MDKETFCNWYDTIHIPDFFTVPGSPDTAYRYEAIDESRQEWQSLIIYILADHTLKPGPIPEGTFRYEPLMLPEGKSVIDVLSFDVREYVFVGDEGTVLGATENAKWAVHAEINLSDTDSQQLKAMLNKERREGVRCSQYRFSRIPEAIASQGAADYDCPKELALFNIDREEDVDRVIESLGQKLKDIGAQVKFTKWGLANTIKK